MGTLTPVLIAVLSLIGIYVAARLISAAFFNSKNDYEERKDK
jgi:hypothetical protein